MSVVKDVLSDLAVQTEVAVKDERIPITPEGIEEWVKRIAKLLDEQCVKDL